MNSNVISIDGPSGSGKTSIGKELAKRLHAEFISSGMVYRALSLNIGEACEGGKYSKYLNNVSKFYEAAQSERFQLKIIDLSNYEISVQYSDTSTNEKFIVRTKFDDNLLYSAENSFLTSKMSQLNILRKITSEYLRGNVHNNNLTVIEGRDIGSVVFKDAILKIYIDSPIELRAKRRLSQSSENEGLKEISERDKMDSIRENSPLIVPDGAFIILNENQTIDEIVDFIEEEYKDL